MRYLNYFYELFIKTVLLVNGQVKSYYTIYWKIFWVSVENIWYHDLFNTCYSNVTMWNIKVSSITY